MAKEAGAGGGGRTPPPEEERQRTPLERAMAGEQVLSGRDRWLQSDQAARWAAYFGNADQMNKRPNFFAEFGTPWHQQGVANPWEDLSWYEGLGIEQPQAQQAQQLPDVPDVGEYLGLAPLGVRYEDAPDGGRYAVYETQPGVTRIGDGELWEPLAAGMLEYQRR